MAKIAGAVYDKEISTLDELLLEDKDFINVYEVNHHTAQAALIEHKDYLCFAFRGTDELLDWFDNLDVRVEKTCYGSFHKGFHDSLKDVWEPLFNYYQELIQIKSKPLFLTGHSLGGAMAMIAIAKLDYLNIPFQSAYTFGQPRAIREDTARILNKKLADRIFRFQYCGDVVTRVPTKLMGFRHVGTLVYVPDSQIMTTSSTELSRLIDFAVDMVDFDGFDFIDGHLLERYTGAIERWKWG